MDLKNLIDSLKEGEEIELENVDMTLEELEVGVMPLFAHEKPHAYTGEVSTVRLGNTPSEGGTRCRSLLIGGEKTMPYHDNAVHPPVIAFDVFDTPIALAKPVKIHYEEVMDDPCAWARKCVSQFGADMVTIHLTSTHPSLGDTPVREAVHTVEDLLQAVDVPLIVGGSGHPEKDVSVLERVAEAAEGERIVLNSASLNADYKRVARAAREYGHVVLSWTQLDINNQKMLNRHLLHAGLHKEDIVIDPTTAALGYGLEYSFSLMERIRISALKGDTDLQCPLASGTTNAWGAREAWMKDSPVEGETWGDRMSRGPLWEAVTALALALAGCDLFMMMCPTAVELVRKMGSRSRDNVMEDAREWLAGDGQ